MSRSILDTRSIWPIPWVPFNVVSGVPFESIWVVEQNPNLWMFLTREAFRFSRLRIHLNPWIPHGFPMDSPWIPLTYFSMTSCSSEWLPQKKGGISGTKHRAWRVSSFGSPSRIPDIGRCRVTAGLGWFVGENHLSETMGLATPVKGFAAFFLKYGGWLGSLGFVG